MHKIGQYAYFVPLCLLAALLARTGWVALVDAQPVSDFRWYYERGIDLAAGRGYSMGPDAYWPENLPPAALATEGEDPNGSRPTAYWPVGYPAFLGMLFTLIGPSLLVARLANVVLYLGVLLLAYHVARILFASELTGRITLLILSFYPNHIAYTSLLASEILFLFLLLLGIALLITPRHRLPLAAASGVVFGLACLVKPQAILIPGVTLVASLWANIKRKALLTDLTRFAIVYVVLGITILPWMARNYHIFDDLVFISNNSGINLLVGNNPYANGAYGHDKQLASMLSHVPGEHARDVEARAMAIEYMISHPRKTLGLWPRKLWYLYRKDVEGISWNENGMDLAEGDMSNTPMLILKALAQAYYTLIVMAFLISIIALSRGGANKPGEWPLPALGIGMLLYFTFISLLTFGDSRFHFPAMPWVVMYVAASADVLARHSRRVAITLSSVAGRLK